MRTVVIIIIIVALVGAGLWFTGAINVPGLPGPSSPRGSSEAKELKPPATEKPADAPRERERREAPTAAAPAPSPTPKPSAGSTRIAPPITNDDLARALACWKKGDLAGVERALAGVSRPDSGAGSLESDAWKLLERARMLAPLLAKVTRSPLASGDLEAVDLAQGGRLLGKVQDNGEHLKITAMGGVETEVTADDVIKREKVARSEFQDKVRQRLKEKEDRAKADDALGQFRLAYFCWTYGLEPEAMPHLERAVDDDAFPAVARVFGGDKGGAIADEWLAYSGKQPPAVAARPSSSKGEVARPAAPAPSSSSSSDAPAVAKARGLYDKAVTRYRASFNDSRDAESAVKDARKLLGQALETLEAAGDAPGADDLRIQISRLLADCRKHGGM